MDTKCNIECNQKELCDKFMFDDEKWIEWFNSLPENFKNRMCEHHSEIIEIKKNK